MAALKEWAIVCKALEGGRQILILRKGGIMEYKQGFEVKHNSFLLYPTFEHQSKESIQPDYVHKLYDLLHNAPIAGRNRITSYAKVAGIKEVTDKSVLQALKKYHIWNDSYVNVKMSYNPKKPMSIVLLRVYQISNPLEVDVRPEWAGCKSWIPIDFVTPTDNKLDQPVLDDLKFNQVLDEIDGALN